MHGFTGHPQWTWTYTGEVPQDDQETNCDDSNERPSKIRRPLQTESSKSAVVQKSVFWPQDLLPSTLPNARIFTYGYDTNLQHGFVAPMNKSSVYDLGYDLLINLEAKRSAQPERPLVFVAHSLG